MTAKAEATSAQIRAADPARSTWVAANAGSGKTRVLTDRVARLLLQNVPPQQILCLTYTKAAASHMQNQLFRRLGEWAMLADADLVTKLSELGEDADPSDREFLRHARTLFARAIETPGGLKIQTIHSFCAALLRRFPLESGVSPQFQEMDEFSGRKLRSEILETLAVGETQAAFDGMARYLAGDDPDKFLLEIIRHQKEFRHQFTKAEIWQRFELPDGYDQARYLKTVFPDGIGEVLQTLHAALLTGKPTDLANARKLAAIDWQTPSMAAAVKLETMFVFESKRSLKTPNAARIGRFPTAGVRNAHPDLTDKFDDLMTLFQDEKPKRVGLGAGQRALALNRFAQVFLPEYERRKQAHGWLDFDDLILKAQTLLTDSAMAQWVLFRLDGGIDHILVDEAQDTSPEQWQVIARLAEEFSTGASARDVKRTLFIVGDEKQSIYSFQGADPAAFEQMRAMFAKRLADANDNLARSDLLFSFRSSVAILNLVDAIFENTGTPEAGGAVRHKAINPDMPGRVDLWPFLPTPEKPEKSVWYDPVDMPAPNDPARVLAGQIADAIKGVLDRREMLVTSKGNRVAQPGDFLVLVQRRSDIFPEIIRALKSRNLPVAGADRLRVGGELAVRDLTSLLSFLTTPEDDLSLAEALRSPLFGVTEAALYQLAQPRTGYLWPEMRARGDAFADAVAILDDLLKHADILRPYEMLERVLTRHKGRENLIARLGKEAEEGIDAFLAQALQYEQMDPPSLTGFLGWISADESDIKRQMDTEAGEIRVMTVHGAKGLESPVVILPDTAKRRAPTLGEILQLDGKLAVWKPPANEIPPAIEGALQARQDFLQQERQRLLYVALTRAESWLIICGTGTQGDPGDSWYADCAQGLDRVGAVKSQFQGREILRYEPIPWPADASADTDSRQSPIIDLPDWATRNAPIPANPTVALNPSDLGGEKTVEGSDPVGGDPAAIQRGIHIHALLEKLPGHDPGNWPALARQILKTEQGGAGAREVDDLLAEVSAVLHHPDLAFIFDPASLAEVGVTAMRNGVPIDGVIDRLVVTDDRVLAVDFKSNAVVPATPEATPEGISRQMGAYAWALAQIYPDHRVETAILWTKTAELMPLQHEIVTQAFRRTLTS